jgi:hypothetical protein
MKKIWTYLSDLDKQRVLDFATPEVKKDLVAYRDHAKNPSNFIEPVPEIRPNPRFLKFLEDNPDLKEKIVKDRK